MKTTTINTIMFIIALFVAGLAVGGFLGNLNYHASWINVKLPLCVSASVLLILSVTYTEYVKDGYSLRNIM